MKKQILILVAAQRSGTTVFQDMLNNSTMFHFHGANSGFEPLDYKGNLREHGLHYYYFEKVKKNPNLIVPHRRTKVYAEYFLEYAERYDASVVGFDLKYDHLREYSLNSPLTFFNINSQILASLSNINARFIHLVRKNYVKGHISKMLLSKTRETGKKQKSIRIEDIALFRKEIIQRRNNIQTFSKLLEESPLKYITLYYEDLFENNTDRATLSQSYESQLKILFSLDKLDTRLNSNMRKTNSSNCQDLIENYDEVIQHINHDEIVKFLLDDSAKTEPNIAESKSSIVELGEQKKKLQL